MKFNIWTVIFQIVNFIVLLVILKRLLYKPVREIMEKRRSAVERKMKDAEREGDEARKLKARHQEELDRLEERKAGLLSAMEEEARRERELLVRKAREESDGIVTRGKALLEEEKRSAAREVRDRILESAAIFSRNLLRDVADRELHEALVRKFLGGLEGAAADILPPSGHAEPLTVELTAAYPLGDGAAERVRELLRAQGKGDVAVAVAVDPSLIAGVRMKAGDQVIDGSLAGQVLALRKRLEEAE
jgi:F-type H+-transporting ATPase subunit b